MTTTAIKTSKPRTTTPAAAVGFQPWRCRVPTNGLKQMARTTANVRGRTISLTKPNAVNTITIATTNPTKLHDHMPILRTQPPPDAPVPDALVSGPPSK